MANTKTNKEILESLPKADFDKVVKYYEDYLGETWDHEYVYDDMDAIFKMLGLQNAKIQYRGFWCKGDGASLTFDWSNYVKGCLNDIKEYATTDTELHDIVKDYVNLHKSFLNYKASVRAYRIGSHYVHENTVRAEVTYDTISEPKGADDIDERFTEWLRDFSRYIYRRLQSDYGGSVNAEMSLMNLDEMGQKELLDHLGDVELSEEGEEVLGKILEDLTNPQTVGV